MNLKTVLLSILCLNFIILSAQNPLIKQWDRRYGGISLDLTTAFLQTNDSGYIIGGYTFSDSSGDITEHTRGDADYWIVKTDAQGIKQWDRRFGGNNTEAAYSVLQTSDHGYIIGGWSSSDSSGDKTQPTWDTVSFSCDYWVIKIDSLGNKLWDKDFGGLSGDVFIDMKQTMDGGYILGGYTASDTGGDITQSGWGVPGAHYDWWVIKIDSIGNKQWDKRYGGLENDYLTCVNQTTDGGYLFAGYTESGVGGDKTQASWGDYDFWIVKTDGLGNKQWDKRYGGTLRDELHSVLLTPDNGFILGGESLSNISGDKTQNVWGAGDMWMVKTDSAGTIQWDKGYGSTNAEELYRIIRDANGNYLISGDSYSPIGGDKTENNLGLEQSWILKTDSAGNKIWDKTVKTTGHDESSMIVIANDSCYTVANFTDGNVGGYCSHPTRGLADYWMVKFCDSTFTTGLLTPGSVHDCTVFPNPFSEELIVSSPQSEVSNLQLAKNKIEIKLFDIYGRTVLSQPLTTSNNKLLPTQIGTANFSPGIYLYEISTTNGIIKTGKVVKE